MMINQEQHVGNQELETCSLIEREWIWNLNDSTSGVVVIVFNIVLNFVLTFAASLGNGMIIVAILRSQNLQTPSYLLITSLAFTDLLMGSVFHPFQIALSIYNIQGDVRGICSIAKVYTFFLTYLGSASLLMVTCISIDRYFALTLRHRYSIIVTKKRVRLLLLFVWIVAFFGAFSSTMDTLNIAEYFLIGACLTAVLLSVTCLFYVMSYRALRLYTVQVQAQQPNPLAAGNFDVVRYKKTLKTMLIVLGCLLISGVPLICAVIVRTFVGPRKEVVIFHLIAISVYCLNSSLNPIIYLVRFVDIRNACRETFRSLLH